MKGIGLTGMFLYFHPVIAAVRCMATEDNILGPFYRPGAPFKVKIAGPDEKGDPLKISGKVVDVNCLPLADAVVDVWQADQGGNYDNSRMFRKPDPKEFRLRGRMKTNENGYYEYETILPGPYRIGFGRWRPKHIHYIVSKPGYESLTTQLYFRGDPYIEDDPFVKDSLIIELKNRGNGKISSNTLHGEFNIVLAPNPNQFKEQK